MKIKLQMKNNKEINTILINKKVNIFVNVPNFKKKYNQIISRTINNI